MKRCVILSAGPVADAVALRGLLRDDDVIIAADGGWKLAQKFSVVPAAIVADFDSSEQPEYEASVEIIRLPVRKDCTDTAAAVDYALTMGFHDFLFLGCTGGRLDHQHAAIQLLVRLAERGCTAAIADDNNRISAVVDSPCQIEPMSGWSLSLFAFGGPVHALTVSGASYDLKNYDLLPSDSLCVSNAVEKNPCTITFSNGTLLVYRSKD